MRRAWPLAILAAGLLLAGCNPQATGPALTEAETQSAWTLYQEEAGAIAREIREDPVLQDLLLLAQTAPLSAGEAPLQALVDGLKALGAPGRLVPLETRRLPRGGRDLTSGEPFEPGAPYDFGLRWTGAHGTPYELLVDWDRDGAETVFVETPDGNEQEVPQEAQARLTRDAATLSEAELSARWCTNPSTGRKRAIPVILLYKHRIESEARLELTLDHELAEGTAGESDRQSLDIELEARTAGGKEGRLKVALEQRGNLIEDCALTGAAPEYLRFRYEGEVPSVRVAFELEAEEIRMRPDGGLESAYIRGWGEVDGETAFTFEGPLDDLGTGGCPGANVELNFADRTTTLAAWLEEQGLCPASP